MRAAFQVCLDRATMVSWQHAGRLQSRVLRSNAVAMSTNASKATYSFQELGIDKDLYNKTSGIRYVWSGALAKCSPASLSTILSGSCALTSVLVYGLFIY